MLTDSELLRQYAEEGDEVAFAELVRRHTDLVYSIAKRITCNGALAEDVTQAVFTTVAQQAERLKHYEPLLGWLHTTARHRAIDAVRGEARRHTREQEATTMQNDSTALEVYWAEIGPLLDEAVGALRQQDRDAVLLRFFKNLSHQQVGAALGLGEEAARKRVDRALEKLNEHFARRGVTASAILLAASLTENSVQAAPAGLAANVTTTALAAMGGGAVGGGFLTPLVTFLMSTKTKIILAVAVIMALVAIWAVKLQNPGAPSASPEVASTAQVKTPTALLKAGPAPVAAPMAAAVAKPVVAPAPAASSSTADVPDVLTDDTPPNADLKTAIPALIRYLEADDFEQIIPFLLTPEEVQQQLQGGKTIPQLAEKFRAELKNHGGADLLAQTLRQIQILDQPPILDPTGTQAMYKIDLPVQGHESIIFIKKDGLWYGPQ